jgi:2,4-dichlorophenol 6-monooxygenase
MEPVLVNRAIARGSQLRFGTEYLSHEQDADGVTATVRDRLRGDTYTIRAKYLIGADGGRSKVAEDAGLPMGGQMGVAGSINIVFDADLTQYVAHRPATLYWVLAPGATVGGIGAGLVRCVRTWNEWLIVWGYDVDAGPPDLTEEYALSVVRKLIGDDEIPVTIKSSSAWTVNEMYAETYSSGRVFCAGDACHRHPPSNGLGSNTSIQDSYNLAWKLAAVLKNQAGPELLETYSTERAPVAEQIVKRANKSSREFGQFFEVLGLMEAETEEEMKAQIEERKANTPRGRAKREALVAAMELKDYEFNAHGVDLGQFYESAAVVPDGSERPQPTRDPELYYQPSTVPGSHLPHVWVGDATHKISTLDLAPYTTFTLITGIAGEAWAAAAKKISDELGVPVSTVIIGPGREVTDIYYDWARIREIEEDGALLVRPDKHIGWRSMTLPRDPEQALRDALNHILSR